MTYSPYDLTFHVMLTNRKYIIASLFHGHTFQERLPVDLSPVGLNLVSRKLQRQYIYHYG